LPDVDISFRPEEKGVDSLARQIKITGRAYPLFQIAQMILQKPDRHTVTFEVVKKPDGTAAQPLFVCALDDSLWLSEDEAVNHVLDHHFATFYQTDRTPTDPPKGTYTFVAQCSMSGVILGPPNYHDYQNQLRKLHEERFSRMPFEAFKARVKIVRDEATVKKWIEGQSFKTEFVCLNVPEPLKLASREEVEKHFRATHLPNIIKSVESFVIAGIASRSLKQPLLLRLLRQAWEDQKRFPLQIATVLSQQFAARGLQFFKVNKTLTHVCVARPHYLDLETTPVSDGVKRIVNYLNAHPKCTRRQLLDALAPITTAASGEKTETAAAAAGADAPSPGESSPEVTALSSDLHWLIHEGHVIEFADGILDTAKKPVVKPPKPATPPAAEKAQTSTLEQTAPEPASTRDTEASTSPAPIEESVVPEASSEEKVAIASEAAAPAEVQTENGGAELSSERQPSAVVEPHP
jgi:hypothetical protein